MGKYKYDGYRISFDGSGVTAACGGTNKQIALQFMDRATKRNPADTFLLLRRPDNVLVGFYSPFTVEVI